MSIECAPTNEYKKYWYSEVEFNFSRLAINVAALSGRKTGSHINFFPSVPVNLGRTLISS